MSRLERLLLLACSVFLVFSVPSSVRASDCYLEISFTETSAGAFSDISFRTISNNLYNESLSSLLLNPDAPRQIHYAGLDEEGNEMVLARFSTGGLLKGVGEGFLGEGSPGESADILEFAAAEKQLFLPLVAGVTAIKFSVDEEYVKVLPVNPTDLVCVKACVEAGQVPAVDAPCCLNLSIIGNDSGGVVCSDIGNDTCESWESERTAPNDCSPDIVVETCGDGFQTPLSCDQLVASYKFQGDGKNLVRRNYAMQANDLVSFSDQGGAIFSGARGALSSGMFEALPVRTLYARFNTRNYSAKQAIVSLGNNDSGLIAGVWRGRIFLQLYGQDRGLTVNGSPLRRMAPIRGTRSGATFFRGRSSLLIGRKVIDRGDNKLVVTVEPLATESSTFQYKLFLNGDEVISAVTNFDLDFEDTAPRFFLGRDQLGRVGGDNSIIGTIYNVKVFTRAVSDLELEELFQNSGSTK